jgi:beta-N-acetylhexosaminidase
MLDLEGPRVNEEERATLRDPLVGGVILFARNYESVAQLRRLTAEVHALRDPPLLIAVDHEGGRVQRCRDQFTHLPPMRALGALWDRDARLARATADAAGFVLAAELRACGVDLSFTPVLDLDYGRSAVIGDRSFHTDAAVVSALGGALIAGLRRAGMSNVGKHFPGHGYVAADSHHAVPVDVRQMAELERDLLPYREHRRLRLEAVMPAHIVFERVDARPAGFSEFWLRTVLRGRFGFEGVIFSDDLSMEGASVAGGIVARAQAARSAGCDMVLVCNDAAAARQLLRDWRPIPDSASADRLASLQPRAPAREPEQLRLAPDYRAALRLVLAV